MKGFLFFSFLFISIQGQCQNLVVTNLVCENLKNPLGIDSRSPALGWQLQSTGRNVLQTAYHILVADDSLKLENNEGNIWDSKKIYSDQSIQLVYQGKKLKSAKTYYWKVMVWDNKNHEASSPVSFWEMGLLEKKDWKGAKWIGYEKIPDSMILVPAAHQKGPAKWAGFKDVLPLFRKNVLINKPVQKATAFVCGLGHFEFSINGQKIGDHFLDPGWTQYDREAQYVSFDITSSFNQGKNALGVMLGNGFYFVPGERYRKLTGGFGFPKLIMRVQIQFTDGSIKDIVTDETWKTAPGPIKFSSIYGGEDYDARMEQSGWNTIEFNDAQWRKAVVVDGVPNLYSQMQSPLKVLQVFTPHKISKIKDAVYLADLGQNASGIPRISVRGKRGDTVRIIPAELLTEDGRANQRATGSPVYFQYILKGDGVETWQPQFSYYGFRYLQVEGCELENSSTPLAKPVLIKIEGLHTRNAAEKIGSFHTSSQLFNRIYELIDWSVKSNMASILTDCPHREKLGWLEQTHLMGNSIHFNCGMNNFFRKTVRDMQTSQRNGHLIPEYVPEYVKMPFMDGIFMDSPEWGSASIILPWYLYKWYGDKKILEDAYPMMKAYLQHLKSRDSGFLLSYGLSDWYDLGPEKPGLAQLTPMGLTATAIYDYDLDILQQAALVLGRKKDKSEFSSLAEKVKSAFNKRFFDSTKMQYGTGSQTSNAMALYMNLVPEKYREAVIDNLIRNIKTHNNSMTTGDIGFRYLLQVLQQEGHSDLIFEMNNRSDVPGYGYQLEKGATALTESWQALPSVSNNHLMLGHLMEWFYSGLGGIRQAKNSVGYKNIEIDPHVVGDLKNVDVSYVSPYGKIESSWKKNQRSFELNIIIPVNSKAVVYLPVLDGAMVLESGNKLDKVEGLKVLGFEKGKFQIELGSGNYHFSVTE